MAVQLIKFTVKVSEHGGAENFSIVPRILMYCDFFYIYFLGFTLRGGG